WGTTLAWSGAERLAGAGRVARKISAPPAAARNPPATKPTVAIAASPRVRLLHQGRRRATPAAVPQRARVIPLFSDPLSGPDPDPGEPKSREDQAHVEEWDAPADPAGRRSLDRHRCRWRGLLQRGRPRQITRLGIGTVGGPGM